MTQLVLSAFRPCGMDWIEATARRLASLKRPPLLAKKDEEKGSQSDSSSSYDYDTDSEDAEKKGQKMINENKNFKVKRARSTSSESKRSRGPTNMSDLAPAGASFQAILNPREEASSGRLPEKAEKKIADNRKRLPLPPLSPPPRAPKRRAEAEAQEGKREAKPATTTVSTQTEVVKPLDAPSGDQVEAQKGLKPSELLFKSALNELNKIGVQLSEEKAKREAAEKECTTLQEQLKTQSEKLAAWDTMTKKLVELEAQLQSQKAVSSLAIGASWQFEINGHWEAFTAEGNEQMHQKYLEYLRDMTDSRYTTINSGGVSRTVDFELMQQEHPKTQKVRRIRVSTGAPLNG